MWGGVDVESMPRVRGCCMIDLRLCVSGKNDSTVRLPFCFLLNAILIYYAIGWCRDKERGTYFDKRVNPSM